MGHYNPGADTVIKEAEITEIVELLMLKAHPWLIKSTLQGARAAFSTTAETHHR
jgi:hypothetical protein